MITDKGINIIANSILTAIDHGEITIDGVVQQLKLYRTTTEKNEIKVFLMLDDSIRGKITETKLISKSNEVLINKSEIIEKDTLRGLLIIFRLKISEVDG